MRIVGGKYRGQTLAALGKGDSGAHLRPTTDRVRENLFNMLLGGRFGDPVTGARVLDLFAGTGALGLEALSRGASHVTFADSGRVAQNLIRDNVKRLGCGENVRLLTVDARHLPANQDRPCSLIFLDPPYGKNMGRQALITAMASNWIASSAVVVWEEASLQDPPEGFELLDQRRYGDTTLTILEAL